MSRIVRLLVVVAVALATVPALAGNLNYNFNATPGTGWTVEALGISGTSPSAWEWSGGPSVDEGGWHTRRGPEGPASGTSPLPATLLVSPYFQVDDVGLDQVQFIITHRFDFPYVITTSGSIPVALGQVQFNVNNGPWLGIRTTDFTASSNHHVPEYANPPAPFASTTPEPPLGSPWSVDAFADTSVNFAAGKHHDSTITMSFAPAAANPYSFGPGDWLRFRFMMGLQVPGSETPAPINWEVNAVQVDGIKAVVVPEPGAVTLAGLGAVLGAVCLRRRARR